MPSAGDDPAGDIDQRNIPCTSDDNGNMIKDGQLEYAYNAENHLVPIRDIDLVLTTYGGATGLAWSIEYCRDNDAA